METIKDKLRQPRWNMTLLAFVMFELLLLIGGLITSVLYQSIIFAFIILNFIIFKYYLEPTMEKQYEEERERKKRQKQKDIYTQQNLDYSEYVAKELEKRINEQESMATQLKNILDNMTQEEFDKVWAEIVAQKLEGPTFSEVIEYYSGTKNKENNEN